MTEWYGIKVGSLYKQTGKGSDDALPVLVATIGNVVRKEYGGPMARVTTLEAGGKVTNTVLKHFPKRRRRPRGLYCLATDEPWPYEEVSQ